MMRFLAAYVVKGRMQAIGVVAVTALLSLFLPPLSYLSGATVALITLRMGLRQGLQLVFGAVLVVGLLALVLMQNPLAGAVFGLVLWLPVWALAVSLRRTSSPARSVLLATLLGMMLVFALHAGVDDPAKWWNSFLHEALQQAMAELDKAEQEQFSAGLAAMATMMTGIMAATMSASLVGCLFLGRWWQALLYNPGGFGEEFRRLRLGSSIAAAALLMVAVPFLFEAPLIMRDLAVVVMVPFAIQGLSVAHGLVKRSGAHSGWLIALYLLLLFTTGQAMVVLAFVGTVDNWFDFRTFFGPKGGADDS